MSTFVYGPDTMRLPLLSLAGLLCWAISLGAQSPTGARPVPDLSLVRFLVFAFNGTLLVGWDAVRDSHARSWAQLDSVRFRTTPQRVVLLGADHVFGPALGRSDRWPKAGSSPRRPYALSLLLARRGTSWVVTQAHESTTP